jgi:leucyl-tRNA synthetase
MEYNHAKVEAKWHQKWAEKKVYKTENDPSKPKYYVLDMFPYPSGAGLHVGHPLGYIATDIVSRYRRLRGYNVLHPMGFDSFGLPAEQYAIETGQHPAVTTAKNIDTYKKQLGKIGMDYDWDREVQTSDPSYYKWTQWIFAQLFDAWYDLADPANQGLGRAKPMAELVQLFEKQGNAQVKAACDEDTPTFIAEQWRAFGEAEKANLLLKYRLTYLADAVVNWCPALGTVLANDEVKDGFSERGGYPVERKLMKQWMMRITAYAERLLAGLQTIDWSEALKESQRNWIGKSYGAELAFRVYRPGVDGPAIGPMTGPNDWPHPQPLPGGEGSSPILNPSLGGKDFPPFRLFATANKEKWKKLKEFARENRKDPTEAELMMWEALRGDQLGASFRRQHAIEDFIVDFVCLSQKLVVEIDGEIHDQPEQKEYDEARTQFLAELGYTELRFSNAEVIKERSLVIAKIKDALATAVTPPQRGGAGGGATSAQHSPLPSGEGPGHQITLTVFTTRIDTTYGVTFVSIAPEHELVPALTTPAQKAAVDEYVAKAKNRAERDRMADVKTVSGVFTGSFVINPFSGQPVPLWVADYVLAGYGTGVVMAVPSGDQRDWNFATHFGLPIVPILDAQQNLDQQADPTKEGRYINSPLIDGLTYAEALPKLLQWIEQQGVGKAKINYRLRDAVFSRQRYWGEPVPVYFQNGLPQLLPLSELPLVLPEIDEYKPTETGEPPLGRATAWKYHPNTPLSSGEGSGVGQKPFPYELSTMPGWAGSSWYFLRYMDARNDQAFADRAAVDYWGAVDLYVGGTEHAVGHLLYSRFWNLALHDLGHVGHAEPFQKLVNQGMIQGESAIAYRINGTNTFVSKGLKDQYDVAELHVDVNIVSQGVLDIEAFKRWRPDLAQAEFQLENGQYRCGSLVEKMSKRLYNVVNPDDIVDRYGADTLRLYEMFLGPLEASKPWNTHGIEGVYRFLKKLWRLFYDEKQTWLVRDEPPTPDELKVLHKLIKKVGEDVENLSLNTSVSAFMVAVNDLNSLKCHKTSILRELLVVLSPFAPHIAEELWQALHGWAEADFAPARSVTRATFPTWNPAYLAEATVEYPISVNGKVRAKVEFPAELSPQEIERQILASDVVAKYTDGKAIKKVIVVPKKIVNVVV